MHIHVQISYIRNMLEPPTMRCFCVCVCVLRLMLKHVGLAIHMHHDKKVCMVRKSMKFSSSLHELN
jgi:hypothetical protein